MLLTIKEYATYIGVSYNTVASAVHRGKIKYTTKIGRFYYIDSNTPWVSQQKLKNDPHRGISHTSIYKVWSMMKTRCYNINASGYCNYGGRGITVCDEWLHSADAFYDWAINNGYKKGLQLDRIDNNKGYSPENCRFVTPKDNCNNRRKPNTIIQDKSIDELFGRKQIEKERTKFKKFLDEDDFNLACLRANARMYYAGVFNDLAEEYWLKKYHSI